LLVAKAAVWVLPGGAARARTPTAHLRRLIVLDSLLVVDSEVHGHPPTPSAPPPSRLRPAAEDLRTRGPGRAAADLPALVCAGPSVHPSARALHPETVASVSLGAPPAVDLSRRGCFSAFWGLASASACPSAARRSAEPRPARRALTRRRRMAGSEQWGAEGAASARAVTVSVTGALGAGSPLSPRRTRPRAGAAESERGTTIVLLFRSPHRAREARPRPPPLPPSPRDGPSRRRRPLLFKLLL